MMEQDRRSALQRYVLGTAGLGGIWGAVDPEASVDAIINALETGIPAIDTAPAYGDGESIVGKALRRWKGPRPQVSTKVGRLRSDTPDQGIYDYTPEGMINSVARSLDTLGLPDIDLLFLHEPAAIPYPEIEPAIAKMMELKQNGTAKKIGLGGNYPPSFLKYIDAGVFDVVMEFNRLDACCTDALDTTLPECIGRGVAYWAASPLHMGLLGHRFRSFIRSRPDWLEERYVTAASAVSKIAAINGLSLPTLALRFLQAVPFPLTIVIGPANQKELNSSYSAIFEGALGEDLYQEIIRHLNNN